MKHVSLETGGKSPNIVFADAGDLDHIAKVSADGVFYNAGQSCNAPTRILVEDKIRDEFVALVARHAKPWTPADPLDPATAMGAVVDADQMNRVLGYIAEGRKEGATVAAGGAQARKETGGAYIEPTVFTDVRNDMKIAQEEIFGPVVVAVSFKDEAEAVRIANDSIYGLQANLWTARREPRPQAGPPAQGGHGGRQQCLGLRHHQPLRRLQAVRHRPRQVAPRHGQVLPGEEHLHPAVTIMMRRHLLAVRRRRLFRASDAGFILLRLAQTVFKRRVRYLHEGQ